MNDTKRTKRKDILDLAEGLPAGATFDEIYDKIVDELGGVAVVRRRVPFDDETLVRAFERDERFNDDSTPIKTWDWAADSPSLKYLLLDHYVTASALSQRVCVLKTAARRHVLDLKARKREN